MLACEDDLACSAKKVGRSWESRQVKDKCNELNHEGESLCHTAHPLATAHMEVHERWLLPILSLPALASIFE